MCLIWSWLRNEQMNRGATILVLLKVILTQDSWVTLVPGVDDVDEDIDDNKGRAECPPGRPFCRRLDSYCFLSLKMMMEMTMRWMSKMQSASSLCNVCISFKKVTFWRWGWLGWELHGRINHWRRSEPVRSASDGQQHLLHGKLVKSSSSSLSSLSSLSWS